MNNDYNANLYLNVDDLNAFENQIKDLTDEVQERVFNNTQSPLRNIQVGDNLSGKTIYLSFPRNVYQYISGSENVFIETNNNYSFDCFVNNYADFDLYNILLKHDSNFVVLYRKASNQNKVLMIRYKYTLPYDVGVVTSIDTNNDIYQYVKIYENEYIIPNYEKHTWVDNEILTMQKIDNIENGIKNIGDYYYKPANWISTRVWLKDLFTTTQNISYKDLNRWGIDLNAINFDNLNYMTIWNSNVSEINWNEQNDTEWEDL